eukprot:12409568-Karenia_brevis.AAC.1
MNTKTQQKTEWIQLSPKWLDPKWLEPKCVLSQNGYGSQMCIKVAKGTAFQTSGGTSSKPGAVPAFQLARPCRTSQNSMSMC